MMVMIPRGEKNEDGVVSVVVDERKHTIPRGVEVEWPACGHKTNMPMTNADKIRAMSDEELAENLTYISEVGCPYVARRCKERCIDCFFDWLQEPAEEVDDG